MKNVYVDGEHWTTVNLMPLYSHAYMITSWEINRKYRGQGWASKIFDRVCADADKFNKILMLSVEPDGTGLDSDALEAFYRRRGFIHIEESETGMVRYPKRENVPGQPAA